jgi:hypothetical protein
MSFAAVYQNRLSYRENAMRAINLFVDDLVSCTPAELEAAIIGLAQSGIEEKFRLDFKEKWEPDKQCPDIVGFANSYGGVLILGVADDRRAFPGIPQPPKSDLKTQLASVIGMHAVETGDGQGRRFKISPGCLGVSFVRSCARSWSRR